MNANSKFHITGEQWNELNKAISWGKICAEIEQFNAAQKGYVSATATSAIDACNRAEQTLINIGSKKEAL